MIPNKRQSTRLSRAGAPASAPPDVSRPTAGPRPATYELIERITSLQLKMAPLEALADAVVPALLDAFAAPAGGLLLYHSEDSSLRLVASRGLSASGCAHLATLRAGAAGGWEIPLHGLLNRKAYIIERPHEHPFVPELVDRDEARSPLNLACIPLYRGQLPVGSLLVIADRRPVTNTEIMTHVLVYDVLALALDAGLRARGEAPAPLSDGVVAALTCDEWTDPRDAARALERELALASSERLELAERVQALEAAHGEARGLLAAQKTLHRELLEAERAEAVRRVAELEQSMASELAQMRQSAEQARAAERASMDEQLAVERNAAATTIRELESTLADREAAFATALQKLQTALQERDAQLASLGGERDQVRQAASEAGDVVRRLHAEIERLERLHATATEEYECARADAQAARGAAAAEVRAAEQRAQELAADLAALADEAASLRAERSQILAVLETPGVEPATAVRALREQVAALIGELGAVRAAHAELERRLSSEADATEARLSAQRRQLHEVRAEHEREIDDLTAGHRNALDEVRAAARREIEALDAAQRVQIAEVQADAQRKVESERFDAQQRLDALRMESRQHLDAAREAYADLQARATAAESRVEVLVAELAQVRDEASRLAEERAHVLAAVDDPSAEPATVIRALRDQVAALEGQLGVVAAERAALERQGTAAAHAAEARLAELAASAESRIAEVRAAAQTSLDDTRRAAETTLAEQRAALAERDALLAEREQSLRLLAEERDHVRHAAIEAGDALRRMQAEVDRLRVDVVNHEDAVREARGRSAVAADRLLELERELGTARAELARLSEERARVLAAVDEDGTEPVAVIRALREQAAALDAQVRSLSDERGRATDRLATERAASAAKLAALESERADAEAQRRQQSSRIAALERDLVRNEDMLAAARRELDAAAERLRTQPAAAASLPSTPTSASPPPAAATAAVLPRVEVLAPPPAPIVESGRHRVLEADPLVRERIAAALAAELPADAPASLFVVNLLSALPDRFAELRAAAAGGALFAAYAADGGRSRILGPMRCFTEPPAPEVVVAAIAKLGSQRRLLSLWEDVDGLIPLKAALGKGGHSISMACDPKQALDLLGMLTPDAVLIDVRTAGDTVAAFLDALALENGRTPSFVVCGDDPATTLRRVLESVLRPTPLDATQLAKVCQSILAPPPPEAASRQTAPRVVRPIAKATPATSTRKTLSRRSLSKRR
ncbi:MAG: hypothetical protein B6D46_14715 [Polyangiaceae bacterium UTPRO1]|jgi:DNA repair exonuclease SbcCD ATPase subunit|nr:MAG: hypothetical protein B6D46_14715 [Polyangiaceae bacterium UTPRO1]